MLPPFAPPPGVHPSQLHQSMALPALLTTRCRPCISSCRTHRALPPSASQQRGPELWELLVRHWRAVKPSLPACGSPSLGAGRVAVEVLGAAVDAHHSLAQAGRHLRQDLRVVVVRHRLHKDVWEVGAQIWSTPLSDVVMSHACGNVLAARVTVGDGCAQVCAP